MSVIRNLLKRRTLESGDDLLRSKRNNVVIWTAEVGHFVKQICVRPDAFLVIFKCRGVTGLRFSEFIKYGHDDFALLRDIKVRELNRIDVGSVSIQLPKVSNQVVPGTLEESVLNCIIGTMVKCFSTSRYCLMNEEICSSACLLTPLSNFFTKTRRESTSKKNSFFFTSERDAAYFSIKVLIVWPWKSDLVCLKSF